MPERHPLYGEVEKVESFRVDFPLLNGGKQIRLLQHRLGSQQWQRICYRSFAA